MKKVIATLAVVSTALTVSACAKRPDQIAAIQMEDSTYSRLSCKQLAREETKIRNNLDAMSADQNSAATKDAWGVFLLGLPVSSMSGGDKEALIGVAKGKLDAIDLVQVDKDCE